MTTAMNREAVRAALTGPVASISTPFCQDDSIDYAALRGTVDFVIEGGSKTVLLTYGDSLYSLLTDDEVGEVTRVVAEQTAGRAMVVAADRMWATPKTLEFARYSRDVGADVLMVLPQDWAASCTQDTLVEHYAAAADEIPVMIVTNYLGMRPQPFAMALLESLVGQIPGVVAIKDDLCGAFARKMAMKLDGQVAILSGGQKQNHLDLYPYGSEGYLSTYLRFKPDIAWNYWDAIQAGQLADAAEIVRVYDAPLFDLLMTFDGGFDAALHGIYELFGVEGRWRRRPYHSLSDPEMERLTQGVRDLGLL